MNSKKTLPYWLAAIRLPQVGPVILDQLIAHFGSLENLFQASRSDWRALNLSDKTIQGLESPDWSSIEREIRWAEKSDHHIITITDDSYPPLLQEIVGAPSVLYIQGDLSLLSEKQVAMVGSRHPSSLGLEMAFKSGFELGGRGVIITSGLAAGIDGASHRGALAAQGKTLAVLGSGLNCIYPKRHQQLSQEILAQGALVSEFYLESPPRAENFPRRNRVISGLSQGVFVVEAALCSGSLITAQYALEQGRDVFAMPGSVSNPLSRGGHSLIKDGAKLVETVEDICSELGSLSVGNGGLNQAELQIIQKVKLSDEHQRLLSSMGYDINSIDRLVSHSGKEAETVLSLLTELELWNYIESVPGGYLARSPKSSG